MTKSVDSETSISEVVHQDIYQDALDSVIGLKEAIEENVTKVNINCT